MEILDHYKRLFDYDRWANRESLASIKQEGQVSGKAMKLISHIIAAEWLWFERLTDSKRGMAVWPELTAQECEAELEKAADAWRDYLNRLAPGDLGKEVSYTNSKGELWSSPVGDILTHLLMHSAYHRGQIASERRQSGQTPANTDFIHCARQGFLN